MEKTPEFLIDRTASQLAHVIAKLASDISSQADNLHFDSSYSDDSDVLKHDVSCLNIIALCDSLQCVIDKLKSSFI